MSGYYAKDGTPIPDVLSWGAIFEDDAYRRVAETTLPDGKWVSTVWLGLDHRFGPGGPPLIFETMVFPSKGNMGELDCERYSTLAEAEAGHAALVAKWSSGGPAGPAGLTPHD